MKAFISYKFTGEKTEAIQELLAPAVSALREAGHDAYTNFFDEDLKIERVNGNFGPHNYIFHALSKINERDFVLVLLTSDEKSEGMLLEVGYALARGVPVVIAIKEDVTKTYLPSVGTTSFTWSRVGDLRAQLQTFDFASLSTRKF